MTLAQLVPFLADSKVTYNACSISNVVKKLIHLSYDDYNEHVHVWFHIIICNWFDCKWLIWRYPTTNRNDSCLLCFECLWSVRGKITYSFTCVQIWLGNTMRILGKIGGDAGRRRDNRYELNPSNADRVWRFGKNLHFLVTHSPSSIREIKSLWCSPCFNRTVYESFLLDL